MSNRLTDAELFQLHDRAWLRNEGYETPLFRLEILQLERALAELQARRHDEAKDAEARAVLRYLKRTRRSYVK